MSDLSSQQSQNQRPVGRAFEGAVVGKSGNKTVRVQVDTVKTHAKYRKQYTASKIYAVHDEKNQANIGDAVSFRECRPISKNKRWRLI